MIRCKPRNKQSLLSQSSHESWSINHAVIPKLFRHRFVSIPCFSNDMCTTLILCILVFIFLCHYPAIFDFISSTQSIKIIWFAIAQGRRVEAVLTLRFPTLNDFNGSLFQGWFYQSFTSMSLILIISKPLLSSTWFRSASTSFSTYAFGLE